MRSIRFAALGLCAALLAAPAAFSQEQRQTKRPGAAPEQLGGPLVAKETLDKLKLTSEQQAKVAKIVKEFDDKAKDNEIKARDAMQKARDDKDRAAYKEAQEKATEARKVREGYLSQVVALLTDEQKRAFAPTAGQERRPGAAAPAAGQLLPPALQERLGLTAEQKEKLNQLQKDFEAKALQVLTEEQRQKYEQFKKGRTRPPEQSRQRGVDAQASSRVPLTIERPRFR